MELKERRELEQLARAYGPPNCWTGTSGKLAAALLRCLKEIDRLKEEQKHGR